MVDEDDDFRVVVLLVKDMREKETLCRQSGEEERLYGSARARLLESRKRAYPCGGTSSVQVYTPSSSVSNIGTTRGRKSRSIRNPAFADRRKTNQQVHVVRIN